MFFLLLKYFLWVLRDLQIFYFLKMIFLFLSGHAFRCFITLWIKNLWIFHCGLNKTRNIKKAAWTPGNCSHYFFFDILWMDIDSWLYLLVINSLIDNENANCCLKHIYLCIDSETDKSVTPFFPVCVWLVWRVTSRPPLSSSRCFLLSGVTHSSGMWDTPVQYTLPHALRPSVRF